MTFIAALDQSGGSTPGALKKYGLECTEDNMYDLMHEFRLRVVASPVFTADRIDSAILFQNSLDRGLADLLLKKGIYPYLKIDKGLEEDGLMKDFSLAPLTDVQASVFITGTKMRSVVHHIDKVYDIVDQQFDYAKKINSMGYVPIIEPEVDINNPYKREIEQKLTEVLESYAKMVDFQFTLKLTIPTDPFQYFHLSGMYNVERIVALSGGYSTVKACHLLNKIPYMSASFSRALLEGLFFEMSNTEFDDRLDKNIEKIYKASVVKTEKNAYI